MAKNVLMIALHCYRVYRKSKEHDKRKTFATYKHLINSPSKSRKYRYPLFGFERDALRKLQERQQHRLLHRTIRQISSIAHRRKLKSPRIFSTLSHSSTSYPFARRRNDGGQSRTAFALYGLPFYTPQVPRPATITPNSSVVAKARVH